MYWFAVFLGVFILVGFFINIYSIYEDKVRHWERITGRKWKLMERIKSQDR